MISERTQIKTEAGVIDFGIGQPQLEILPRDLLWRAAQSTLSEQDNSSLNYGHPKGDGRFRHGLAQFLQPHYGTTLDPDLIFTTNGSSQALHLIAHLFAETGDTILVEEPAYFLAHQIFRDRGLNLVGVPMEEDGPDLKALEKLAKKHKPSLFYTIPVFHNPTGISTSTEKKLESVNLAQKHGFLLVCDEVYQLLHYGAPPPPSYAAYVDSEVVLAVGSFSKILAPALRLGWLHAAPKLLDKILACGLLRSGGGLNHFVSCLVGTAINDGSHAKFTQRLRTEYAFRVDVMDRCLQNTVGDLVEYRKPSGGYFFWLKLPDNIDTEELLPAAADAKTGFRPGSRFSNEGGMKNFMRLSFARYNENAISVGVDRLAKVIREAL